MSELSVWSVGASTPLGMDARQTALFWRAGKADPRGTPFRDKTGLSVGAVRAERIPDEVTGYDRMLELTSHALEEVISTAPPHQSGKKTVLLLSLPEMYEGEDPRIATELLFAAAKRGALELDDRSAAIRLGRAGFAALLGRVPMFGPEVRVIVGGVDSYFDAARIAMMDSGYRILSARSGNGFIPGEAAAFACLSSRSKKSSDPPLATIRFSACGEEDLEGPPVATCLTTLLADPRLPSPIPWVLTDVNGERHRVQEWTYASLRNRTRISPPSTSVQHVPTEMGDVGAASGALLLSIAVMGITLGFGGSGATIVTASEGKERGIFHVEGGQ